MALSSLLSVFTSRLRLHSEGLAPGAFILCLIVLFASNGLGPPASSEPNVECRAIAGYARSVRLRSVDPVLGLGEQRPIDCTQVFAHQKVDTLPLGAREEGVSHIYGHRFGRAVADPSSSGRFRVDMLTYCGQACGGEVEFRVLRLMGHWFVVGAKNLSR